MNENKNFLPSVIIGVAFLIGVIIFSMTWRGNQNANQAITVTGSAKKEIVSDFGILRGTITATAFTADAAFRELQNQKKKVIDYIVKQGFSKEKITFFTVTNYAQYELNSMGYSTNIVRGFVYNQRVEVQSEDVNLINKLSLEISGIVEQGVTFYVEPPDYHYSNLAAVKIEIQAEAAKDAMERAKKIAEATGRSIGSMKDARMGILQITPKYSNQISDYGVNDLSSIEKEITAVVSASFELD